MDAEFKKERAKGMKEQIKRDMQQYHEMRAKEVCDAAGSKMQSLASKTGRSLYFSSIKMKIFQ